MLINLRNALMTWKRLPYDAEVEYLKSTGTQWIDTGVVWKSVTTAKIEAIVQYTQTSGRQITCGASTAFYFGCNANRWEYAYRLYTGTVGTGVTTVAKEVTSAETKFYINGSVAATFAQPASQAWWGGTAYVFGLNNGGTFALPSSVRVYGLKIWIDGVLVFDSIPVRKGTVGYLYDRVTGALFGNAGTGDFVLGPDVVPVEYIESHGTEYIDTGVYLTSNHSVEIDFQLTAISQSRKGLFGGLSISRYGALLSPSNNSLEFGYGSNNVFYQITPDALRHLAKQQKNLLYLDGVLINTFNEATFTSNFPAPLGNFSYKKYAPAQAKYYLSKWYDGDTPIRSFRPVRVGTEGAMMDVLTRRIYRNAGTGAFAYGNDLKYPIPAE